MKKELDHCDVLDEIYNYINLIDFSLKHYEEHYGKILYFSPSQAIERRDSIKHYYLINLL